MSKRIVLFDPSYGTMNMGDFIINEAIMSELRSVFDSGFTARLPTQTPVLHNYQMLFSTGVRNFCRSADLKFLGGTNLIKVNLAARKPGWNINLGTADLYRNSISVGCGIGGSGQIKNRYTRSIYRKVLSREFVHSVRDERTAVEFRSLGLQALNTGCPTMWALTSEHCRKIPQERGDSVIFTVTDYAKNPALDLEILRVLRENYEKVHVWLQGSRDHAYLTELGILDQVSLIPSSLAAFRSVLLSGNVDYVGTRLHAGIFAMRNQNRSIILAVDHRALDIQETHNLNVLDRADISSLEKVVPTRFATEVKLQQDVIDSWKGQFSEFNGQRVS